jgi:hypothetical protein
VQFEGRMQSSAPSALRSRGFSTVKNGLQSLAASNGAGSLMTMLADSVCLDPHCVATQESCISVARKGGVTHEGVLCGTAGKLCAGVD